MLSHLLTDREATIENLLRTKFDNWNAIDEYLMKHSQTAASSRRLFFRALDYLVPWASIEMGSAGLLENCLNWRGWVESFLRSLSDFKASRRFLMIFS